jgi:glycosyltransferase involved in cell wall biosynthesis
MFAGPVKTLLRPTAIRAIAGWLRWRRRLAARRVVRREPRVAVVGFLETASGLGTAARGLLAALAPWQPRAVSISTVAPTPRVPTDGAVEASSPPDAMLAADVAVHVFNPDVLWAVVRRHGPRLFLDGRLALAVVNWETQRLPRGWRPVLAMYDVLCAPSTFTARAVAAATGRPVAVLPNCVPLRPLRRRGRDDGRFEFLCLFDHHSDLERKHPRAAIRAFVAACRDLPPGIGGRLRVKCHGDTPPDVVASLRAEAQTAPIEIVARTLSAEDMERLWNDCDCLVSLHRSEGFGLPVAEAIARGIPVITTGQGGVLDFVAADGCLLVPGGPARPTAERGPYREWSGWVEPDPAAAAAAIRSVILEYPAALARAEAARARLAAWAAPEAVQAAFLAAVATACPLTAAALAAAAPAAAAHASAAAAAGLIRPPSRRQRP